MQQSKIKVDLKQGIMSKMKSIKMDRELKTGAISGKEAQEMLEQYHDVSLFNKCIEEETRAISNIAKTFVRRNDYYKKFGQRDLSSVLNCSTNLSNQVDTNQFK